MTERAASLLREEEEFLAEELKVQVFDAGFTSAFIAKVSCQETTDTRRTRDWDKSLGFIKNCKSELGKGVCSGLHTHLSPRPLVLWKHEQYECKMGKQGGMPEKTG